MRRLSILLILLTLGCKNIKIPPIVLPRPTPHPVACEVCPDGTIYYGFPDQVGALAFHQEGCKPVRCPDIVTTPTPPKIDPTATPTNSPTPTAAPTLTPEPTEIPTRTPLPCSAPPPMPNILTHLSAPCKKGFIPIDDICYAQDDAIPGDTITRNLPWLIEYNLNNGHMSKVNGWHCTNNGDCIDSYGRPTVDLETFYNGHGRNWYSLIPNVKECNDTFVPTLVKWDVANHFQRTESSWRTRNHPGPSYAVWVDTTMKFDINCPGPPVCDQDHWDDCHQKACNYRYWDDPRGPIFKVDGYDFEYGNNPFMVLIWAGPGSTFNVTACPRPDIQTEDGIKIPVRGSGCFTREGLTVP